MIAFSIGVMAIVIFMQTPFYDDLLQTIQGASSSVNDIYDGNTMSVRLYSLASLEKNWNGKPMGFAFFGTAAFKRFFLVGSNDDLGYLGNWYTMGWYCVPMIILLITGYLYTSIRNFGKNNVELLYAMLIYLLTTGISLSCFDLARIDVIPFLLFLLQTWKWDRDELEELEYKNWPLPPFLSYFVICYAQHPGPDYKRSPEIRAAKSKKEGPPCSSRKYRISRTSF